MLFVAVVIASFSRPLLAQDKKMTPDELVSRHLEAVGNSEARASARTRSVRGSVNLIILTGKPGNYSGKALMISEREKFRYIMKFPSLVYPGDEMAFDGSRTDTSIMPEGGRSRLGLFFQLRDIPLSEGLLGGVLSTAWPLMRMDRQQPRLQYKGIKKSKEGRMYRLDYRPRESSQDLKISLYFDSETFRHVRTDYEFEIGERIGIWLEDSYGRTEGRYLLTEEFGDHRKVDDLVLPHYYRQRLSVITRNGSLLNDWILTAEQIHHNRSFEEGAFKIR